MNTKSKIYHVHNEATMPHHSFMAVVTMTNSRQSNFFIIIIILFFPVQEAAAKPVLVKTVDQVLYTAVQL